MRTTRVILLASLLVAMMYVIGVALAAIPNVELVTALAFISGYLLGPRLGALVGAAGMGAHSLFNVLGAVAPPVWLTQMGSYALIGFAGGILGPWLVRMSGRVRAGIIAAVIGAGLIVIYQIAVNVVAFLVFTSDVDVWKYVWMGIAFGMVQVAWNAAFFGLAMPPMLRVLARHRRELRAQREGAP